VTLQKRITFSPPVNQVSIIIAVLIFLTSSFDVFLVLEAGGNYRFCQLITPLLLLMAFAKALRGRIVPVLGALPLSIWLGFQILFIPSTDFWPKSLAYCVWLFLNIGMIFAFVQLFSESATSLLTIFRWYLYSFGLLAAFGIVQFFLPVLGLASPYVQQWWIPGELPRVNGLSYEPSYFATYLLTGFVITGCLLRSRSSLLPRATLLAVHLLTGVGIVLSSSRMGIVFLFFEMLLTRLKPWGAWFKTLLRRRPITFRPRALMASFFVIAFISTLGIGVAETMESNPALVFVFLNGTGVSDTAAHSVIQREGAFEATIAVFLKHPFIGRSLGGVSAAIADLEGENVRSFKDSKDFEGMSVFAEALAASGVIGVLPFVGFLITTFRQPWRMARVAPTLERGLLDALLRSLAFEWAILQFNQNMLRPYLWIHLALLAAVYAHARQSVNTGAASLTAP
jgi:hypothetical protein